MWMRLAVKPTLMRLEKTMNSLIEYSINVYANCGE
jgi:hypothetical protein